MSIEAWAPFAALTRRCSICDHIGTTPRTERTAKFLTVICRVCNDDSPFTTFERAVPSFIPSRALAWDGLSLKSTVETSRNKHAQAPRPTRDRLEDFLADFATSPTTVDMLGKTLAPKKSRSRVPSVLKVYRATAQGTHIVRGGIVLPQNGVLLLDGHGAHFERTRFSGSAIICAGPDYSGTFHSCTFSNCQVYVVHGAAVTFRDCAFGASGVQWGLGPAVLASGPASCATLIRCTVDHLTRGLLAESGASIVVASSAVTRCGNAITVIGASSRGTVHSATLRGQRTPVGIRLYGGSVRLVACTVTHFCTAIGCCGSCRVEVDASTLVNEVQMVTGCLLMLRGSSVEMPEDGRKCAISLGNDDSTDRTLRARAQLERCCITHHDTCMAAISSAAAMHLCRLVSTAAAQDASGSRRGMGVCATDGSRVVMSHCDVTSALVGVAVFDGSSMHAAWCQLSGGSSACAVSVSHSRVKIVDSNVGVNPSLESTTTPARPALQAGVHVSEASELRMLRTRLVASQIQVSDSVLLARDCTLDSAGRGDISESKLENFLGSATGMRFSQRPEPAVEVTGSASRIAIRGGVMLGFGVGLRLTTSLSTQQSLDDWTSSVSDVLFAGCQTSVSVGATAGRVAALDVSQCTVRGGVTGARVLCEPGGQAVLHLRGCAFTSVGGAAVWAQDSACATVTRCRFDECDHAVHAWNTAAVRMHDSELLSCRRTVTASGCAPADEPGACSVCGCPPERALQAALAALRASGGSGVSGARCVHEGGTASVTMERVVCRSTWGVVYAADAFGRVTKRDVHSLDGLWGHDGDMTASAADMVGQTGTADGHEIRVMGSMNGVPVALLALSCLSARDADVWQLAQHAAHLREHVIAQSSGAGACMSSGDAALGEADQGIGLESRAGHGVECGQGVHAYGVPNGQLTGEWMLAALRQHLATAMAGFLLFVHDNTSTSCRGRGEMVALGCREMHDSGCSRFLHRNVKQLNMSSLRKGIGLAVSLRRNVELARPAV